MLKVVAISVLALGSTMANAGSRPLVSNIVPFGVDNAEQIILKNDSFAEQGGQAFLQLGFVQGEMAGVWVQVPEKISLFKVDSFRILYGSGKDGVSSSEEDSNQVFFLVGITDKVGPAIPAHIENAAQVTPGPYWNDIPAIGEGRTLSCVRGGQFVGAALEFTHTGSPSVFRDMDGLQSPTQNLLYAIPGGWNYSVAHGLRGDWILRIVGHEATAEECQ